MQNCKKKKESVKEVSKGEVIKAINHHLEDMDETEQIMVLRYIHKLKDLRIH